MFGKKKIKELRVVHYEGIQGFATNCPCNLNISDNTIIIKKLKPLTTVTLPLVRVKSISSLGEYEFMRKYHSVELSLNSNPIAKYYLVIEYDKGMIALWGTGLSIFKNFQKIQEMIVGNETTTIEL